MVAQIQKIKRYRKGLSSFVSSEKGQRFFNFAYSIGAAIVIWGALFKILHLPGGNFLLSLGMGTEVLMFVLTAFDRPPREYNWEKVYPQLAKEKEEEEEEKKEKTDHADGDAKSTLPAGATLIVGQVGQGSVAGTNGPVAGATPAQAPAPTDMAGATEGYVAQIAAVTEQLRQLQESTKALNTVSDTLLGSYRAITDNSEDITRSSSGYVEEMQALNRNIAGLNTIYEIQLKSVSSQLDAIDRVNKGIKEIRDMYERSSSQSARYCEETEKMARYMQQLNQVYEKMITAMTINMYNPMGAAMAQQPQQMPQQMPQSAENTQTPPPIRPAN